MAEAKKTDEEKLEAIVGTLGKGIKATFTNLTRAVVFLLVVYGCYYAIQHKEQIYPDQPLYVYAVWLLPFVLLFAFAGAAPKGFDEQFEDIAFRNRKGDYPKLISKKKERVERGDIIEYKFKSVGMPVQDWRNRMQDLESALDCNILSVRQDKESKQAVVMRVAGSNLAIPERCDWKDDLLIDEEFVLTVGIGLVEQVSFNLNKYPHGIIAGQTGSGKSVILRCLLWQSILKGAKVYIADFKGGVEFDQAWEKHATVVTETDTAIALTNHLVAEMKKRMEVFRNEPYACKNIVDYNKHHPEAPLCRIILACDEAAEMLATEGLEKEEKQEKQKIIKNIESLARLSRAAGINMLLGMQRPDAKVVKGQIKSNTPIRISGRFEDAVASEIVLGNPKAAYLSNTLGRFLYNFGGDTIEFQSFYFDDETMLKDGDFQKGATLTDFAIDVSEEAVDIEDSEYRDFEIPKTEQDAWSLDMDFE